MEVVYRQFPGWTEENYEKAGDSQCAARDSIWAPPE
jgi:hypothetical protein